MENFIEKNEKKLELKIEGISCQACVAKIERKLSKTNGIKKVLVNISNNMADIDYNENEVKAGEIIKIIEKLGYIPKKREDLVSKDEEIKSQNKLKIESTKAKISIILSFILMYISMSHMLYLKLPNIISPENSLINYVSIQFILAIIIMLIGKRFYRVGFRQIFMLSPNMDSLVAVGTGSAFIYSLYISYKILINNDIHLIHSLYYESAGMIIAFVMLGKYLENLSKGRAAAAIKKLVNFQAKKANIIRDDKIIEVDIEEIAKGDIVFIKPGEKIPVDGEIVEGYSTVDEAMITGESIPVEKNKYDKVYSGSLNKDGVLKVKVNGTENETLIAKIAKLVEEAQMTKAPIAKLADKVSLIFVPTVIFIAIFSAMLWWFLIKYNIVTVNINNFEFILTIFISILIIACPCSLGLATPTAIMVGTGKGAELGILIKSGEALEKLNEINTVVFDKTGTLTAGKPEVIDVVSLKSLDSNKILKIAASMEINSEHPLGKAIYEKAKEMNIDVYTIKNFVSISGKGVIGEIEEEKYLLGNIKLLKDYGIKNLEENENIIKKYEEQGKISIFLANKKEIIAFITLADVVKEESLSLIKKLKKEKIKTYMLTGDNKRTAKVIAEKLGIDDVIAEVSPEDKYMKIRELQKQEKKVLMVGDGINDSPALAQADVGMAIGSGTDIAIESADIVLMNKNIEIILTAIRLSKATIKNIKQNLFWAFFYNICGIPIAGGLLYLFTGHLLNPMIAGLAMGLSSVSVVTNALRLKKFK